MNLEELTKIIKDNENIINCKYFTTPTFFEVEVIYKIGNGKGKHIFKGDIEFKEAIIKQVLEFITTLNTPKQKISVLNLTNKPSESVNEFLQTLTICKDKLINIANTYSYQSLPMQIYKSKDHSEYDNFSEKLIQLITETKFNILVIPLSPASNYIFYATFLSMNKTLLKNYYIIVCNTNSEFELIQEGKWTL